MTRSSREVEEERARCCRDVCTYCQAGSVPVRHEIPFHGDDAPQWYHRHSNQDPRATWLYCYASPIRRRAEKG